MPSAPSPVRLALWLCVPLVVLAAAGLWLVRAERARVEVELRRDAERWVEFVRQHVCGVSTEESVAALAVSVPPNETPAPGPDAAALAEARAALKAGRGDDAVAKLDALRARPGMDSAVSEASLPLLPLIHRLLFEAQPDTARAESLVRAAVRYPSILSPALVEDAAASLTPEDAASWRRRADEAVAMTRDLARGAPTPGWHLERRNDGSGGATSLEEVGKVVRRAAGDTAHLLPSGLSAHVEWFGHMVLPATGPELASAAREPWRVGVVLSDPGALEAAAAERVRWLAWILAAGVAVTAFALWVAWRAFRRQAELSRAQMEFVASVSHELRTPVASITALAERLDSGQADGAQTTEYHQFIGREGRRLASLVENVLDFSRLERGKRAFVMEPVDLPALVRETASLMRPHAEEKGLTLVENIVDVPEDRWPPVDALAIRQALVNLLDNAIKFTPAGGRVELGMAEESGALVFHVSDTGIGIEPRERSRIFERFYRVDNSLTRETTGAGIGLSLVRQIAEAHGARVDVDSDPGRFTRFSLRFPPVPCASC
ncbi:MAG: sensor histidine kinase [Verrucomicrobiales bacterium]